MGQHFNPNEELQSKTANQFPNQANSITKAEAQTQS